MRNGKLSHRAMLKASTALAAGAIVTQPLDVFAQPSAVQAALIARAKSFELDAILADYEATGSRAPRRSLKTIGTPT